MKRAKDLTPQERVLVVARHEGLNAYSDKLSGVLVVSVSHGHGVEVFYELDDATIGPIWDKYKAAVIDKMLSEFVTKNLDSGKDRLFLEFFNFTGWYKTATLDDEVNALIDYWYPDGITEEMLR